MQSKILYSNLNSDILSSQEEIEKLLAREVVQIGLVGKSQEGKSTLINAMIGVPILPEGEGTGACTSNVIRLRRSAPGDYQLSIEYFTRSEVEKVIVAIARFLKQYPFHQENYEYHADDEEKLVHELGGLESEIRGQLADLESRGSSSSADNVSKTDVDMRLKSCIYLRDLLQAKRKNERLLGHPAVSVRVTSNQDIAAVLKKLAHHNHSGSPGSDTSEELPDARTVNSIVTELVPRINVRSPDLTIPEAMEFVDLPGFGTIGKRDDLISEEFLPQTDGAIYIRRFGNLEDESYRRSFEMIRDQMRKNKNVNERLWIGFSFCDSANLFNAKAFETHRQGFRKAFYDTTEDRFFFCTNFYYRLLRDKKPVDARQHLLVALGATQSNTNGSPVVDSSSYPSYAGFKPALQGLCEDGGINYVRDLLHSKLLHGVRLQVRQEVAGLLRDLTVQLQDLIIRLRNIAKHNTPYRKWALVWYGAILETLNEKVLFQLRLKLQADCIRPGCDEVHKILVDQWLQELIVGAAVIHNEGDVSLQAEYSKQMATAISLLKEKLVAEAGEAIDRQLRNYAALAKAAAETKESFEEFGDPLHEVIAQVKAELSCERGNSLGSLIEADIASFGERFLFEDENTLGFPPQDLQQLIQLKLRELETQTGVRLISMIQKGLYLKMRQLREIGTHPELSGQSSDLSEFDDLATKAEAILAGVDSLVLDERPENQADPEVPEHAEEIWTPPGSDVQNRIDGTAEPSVRNHHFSDKLDAASPPHDSLSGREQSDSAPDRSDNDEPPLSDASELYRNM
ncbi:dynamin family protein [Blastopirellula marina]|nr:dynamin family protein [Blastopirellula marina]